MARTDLSPIGRAMIDRLDQIDSRVEELRRRRVAVRKMNHAVELDHLELGFRPACGLILESGAMDEGTRMDAVIMRKVAPAVSGRF